MAEDTSATTVRPREHAPAEPPGGGRQDHDVMRVAAMLPIHGPGATDTLASAGGLDVPGREPHAERAGAMPGSAAAADAGTRPHEIIPGAREGDTLTHREPGAIGGEFAGADLPSPTTSNLIDVRTATEHAREGGDASRKGAKR